MLEDPVGYSTLDNSIPGFGLLFLENPWVLNAQSYLEAMLVKLEGQVFKSYEMQASLPGAYAF